MGEIDFLRIIIVIIIMLLVLLLVCELMEENCSFLNLILCGKQEKQEKVVFLILFVKSVEWILHFQKYSKKWSTEHIFSIFWIEKIENGIWKQYRTHENSTIRTNNPIKTMKIIVI